MSTLKNLIKISNDIEESLYESGGEITPEIETQLAELTQKLPTKIDNYAVIIERAQVQAEYLKAKAEHLNSIRKGLESLVERLKDSLKEAAQTLEVSQLEGSEYKVVISRTKPKVDLVDETILGDEFLERVITFKANKEKISKALQEGQQVAGARLLESYSVRIKPNVKG